MKKALISLLFTFGFAGSLQAGPDLKTASSKHEQMQAVAGMSPMARLVHNCFCANGRVLTLVPKMVNGEQRYAPSLKVSGPLTTELSSSEDPWNEIFVQVTKVGMKELNNRGLIGKNPQPGIYKEVAVMNLPVYGCDAVSTTAIAEMRQWLAGCHTNMSNEKRCDMPGLMAAYIELCNQTGEAPKFPDSTDQ